MSESCLQLNTTSYSFNKADTMSAGNHVGILTFANTIRREVGIKPIAQNKFDLAAVVESARAEGGTALYDAVKKAVEMADAYPLSGDAIRGVVLLSDGIRTDGKVGLSDLIQLRTDQEQVISQFTEGDKKGLHGSGLAFSTSHPVHVFSIAYGNDADLEVLRIFSEATNSTFNKATEKNITEVLEIFSKYF